MSDENVGGLVLLPCPGCGGDRTRIIGGPGTKGGPKFWAGCDLCRWRTWGNTEEDAILSWNTRVSAHGQPVVDEDAQEAIADILNRMESWSKAYPVEVFHEPTKEERDWLHKTRPGLMDCIAASMGRHMAKRIADDLAKLTAALTGATP